WLPRKWSWRNVKATLLFRGGLSGRARDFNWPNVIGIWCAVQLFLIVLSGVVMSYPWANNLSYRLTGSESPAPGDGSRGEGNGGGRGGERSGRRGAASVVGLNAAWAVA